MKRIDELGISKTPWKTFEDNWIESADGNPAMSNAAYACNQNDARLIAAAPELYECLLMSYLHMLGKYDYTGCEVQLFKKALAKASGEEAK